MLKKFNMVAELAEAKGKCHSSVEDTNSCAFLDNKNLTPPSIIIIPQEAKPMSNLSQDSWHKLSLFHGQDPPVISAST